MAGRHDSVYKLLFSHPTFVQQLMQGFAPSDISQHLDYSTLLSGNYVTPALKKKLQDIVWSVTWRPDNVNQSSDGSADQQSDRMTDKPHDAPTGESTLYICILLEFQAKTDYDMPLRMLQYTTSFYQQHIKEKKLKLRKDKLPLVFPIVLYSGKAPWKAASAIQPLLMAYPKALAPFPSHHTDIYSDNSTHVRCDNWIVGAWIKPVITSDQKSLTAIVRRLTHTSLPCSSSMSMCHTWVERPMCTGLAVP